MKKHKRLPKIKVKKSSDSRAMNLSTPVLDSDIVSNRRLTPNVRPQVIALRDQSVSCDSERSSFKVLKLPELSSHSGSSKGVQTENGRKDPHTKTVSTPPPHKLTVKKHLSYL